MLCCYSTAASCSSVSILHLPFVFFVAYVWPFFVSFCLSFKCIFRHNASSLAILHLCATAFPLFAVLFAILHHFAAAWHLVTAVSSFCDISNPFTHVNHKDAVCSFSLSEKVVRVVFDTALSLLHSWWWNDLKDERQTERWRYDKSKRRDRRRTRQRENKEDVIPASLLQHSFSLYRLIFSLLFALPLIFCFYYSSSLPVSIISFYLSVSLAFCCSDTQTNEPWNIRHQDRNKSFCVRVSLHMCVCGWQAVHVRVCVCSFWLRSLSGLLVALEVSPPVFGETFVIQEIIWQRQNQIGCEKLWIHWLLHSWPAKEGGCFMEISARNLTSCL